MTSLFHVRIGEFEMVRDFMKQFEVVLLQLEAMSPNMALQAIK